MQSEIEALPEPLAQEVLDFILFVKGRRAGAKAVAAGQCCALVAAVGRVGFQAPRRPAAPARRCAMGAPYGLVSARRQCGKEWRNDMMAAIRERYVVDEAGARVSVLLDVEDYRRLLAELEELESLRAYDAAKAAEDESISFEQAVAEIEQRRR